MGKTAQAIQLDGAGESPQVKVTGPGGETLDTSGGRFVYSPDGKIRILRFDTADAHFTTVGLQGVAAGAWKIEPLPGSAPIVSTSNAKNPADAKVSGHVKRGRGDKRVLTFTSAAARHSRSSSSTSDPRGARKLIGVTAGGHGSITFSPGPDKGKHKIVASFSLERHRRRGANGHELHAAAAGAGGAARPEGPAQGHRGAGDLARRGGRDALRARAARGPAAVRLVTIAHARLPHVAKTIGGLVTVRAVGNYRQSKVTRASFKRLTKTKQPLKSLKKCSVRKGRVRCH